MEHMEDWSVVRTGPDGKRLCAIKLAAIRGRVRIDLLGKDGEGVHMFFDMEEAGQMLMWFSRFAARKLAIVQAMPLSPKLFDRIHSDEE